ncbi:MAG TPA: ankyrin repeat domain-containing protein [bacterium]|nr:ankyrin repeat domain-containing protein [bacterium]HQO92659.1 ankyrin repeat domain-containing protein [bacterium]
MVGYKAIIKDGLILMAFSAVFALVFKLGFDQLRGTVQDDPLITASLQDNVDMMISILSEESFKKNPEGKESYEKFTKFMTNKQDEQKRTPLMWVAYMNFDNNEIVKNKEEKRLVAAKLLLEKGADQTLKDEHGWTALSWASWTGLPTLVSLFIENGADLNIADVKGQTPLMIASLRGNDEVVRILLENGADRELKNSDGKTALDIAQEYINKYSEKKSNYEKIITTLQTVVKVEEPKPAEEPQAAEEEKPATEVPVEQKAE